MNGPTRADAQQRCDDIRVFRAELERLSGEGILQLSEGQRAAVQAHHDALLAGLSREFDIDRDLRAKTLSRGMQITSFLGARAVPRDALREAREASTRLFVVDADRDRGTLRARYPDRERYAIVRGRVRAVAEAVDAAGGPLEWRGWIEGLDVASIHVALPFRAALGAPPDSWESSQAMRFEVTLAFGRRGEPWIVAAQPAAP